MRVILGLFFLVTAIKSLEDSKDQPPRPSLPRQPVPVRPFPPGNARQPLPGQPILVNSQTNIQEENSDILSSSESPSVKTTVSSEAVILSRRSSRPGVLRKRTRTPPVITSTETYIDEETNVAISREPSDVDIEEESGYEEVTTPVNEFLALTKNLTFDCSQYSPGFYANEETGCRIWHYCHGDVRYDNMCPAMTIFDQELLTCVLAADFNCSQASQFYERNKYLYITVTTSPPRRKMKRRRTTTPPPSEDYIFQPDQQ